jgi:hypothetical protein
MALGYKGTADEADFPINLLDQGIGEPISSIT